MTEFDRLKKVFLDLGFDIEKYKIDDLHYKFDEEYGFQSEKLNMNGYYTLWFEIWLNEDMSIKKVDITSFP